MNIDTTLGVVGLFFTVCLGYLGLRYTLKYRKKIEIIFLKNASISLFKTIVKNLDEIEITFQGNRINENIVLFKGTFFNNGNVDIEKSIVHKPLEIELPDNYNWVRHKIIDSSDGLSIATQQNGKKLSFEWDLLKEGEYFTFDSLVEYRSSKGDDDRITDIGKKLVRTFKINHRITDLKSVGKEGSMPRPLGWGGLVFMSIFILGFVGLLSYFSLGQFVFPKYQVLNEIKIENSQQYVILKANDENSVKLLNEKTDEIENLNKTELEKRLGGRIKIEKEKIDYASLIGGGLIALLYFIIWISLLFKEFREKRLYRKLKTVADKYDDLNFEERRSRGMKLFEVRF